MIDKDKNITWHNSEIGNFNSYIGFDKESQLGWLYYLTYHQIMYLMLQ